MTDTFAPTDARRGGPRVDLVPVRGVRKATASAMIASVRETPQASVWKEVDMTRTMEYVARLRSSQTFDGVRVSPLLVVSLAVLRAIRRTPTANAAWSETPDGAFIRIPHDINLGIAVATPRGLIVPNIKNARELSSRDLASAITRLATTARDGKATVADQQGGTITITNFGVFGVDGATPLLNPGQTTILGIGSIRKKPWVVDDELRPRHIATVTGSFDHRVIDGEEMSRFVTDITGVLEDPALLLE